MWINPNYDRDITCLWCNEELVLPKKEIWCKSLICPKCGKEMGLPHFNNGERRNPNTNIMEEYHEARSYSFKIMVGKGKLIRLIEGVCNAHSYIHDIEKIDRFFMVHVELTQKLELEGIEFKNPPMAMGM